MINTLIIGIAILTICLPTPSQATDQNWPVLDVIVADVNGDLEGFLCRNVGPSRTLRVL